MNREDLRLVDYGVKASCSHCLLLATFLGFFCQQHHQHSLTFLHFFAFLSWMQFCIKELIEPQFAKVEAGFLYQHGLHLRTL